MCSYFVLSASQENWCCYRRLCSGYLRRRASIFYWRVVQELLASECRVFVYVCVCVHVSMYVCMCLCVCEYVCVYVSMYVCMCLCVCEYVCVYVIV